jgi:hypothetical protein
MPYGTIGASLGIGSYVGEIRQGPDGQLYEWVEGVDGLGNPIGFWKGLRKLVSGGLKKLAPMAEMIPGVGPIIAKVRGVARKFCGVLPRLEPCVQNFPDAAQPFQIGTKVCNVLKEVGIAGADGFMQSPDGQLYEVVEGIGASGERRKFLRPMPVNIIIPAYIKRRRRRGVRHGLRAGALRSPVLGPVVASGPVPVLPQPVLAPPVVAPAAPFRRFR